MHGSNDVANWSSQLTFLLCLKLCVRFITFLFKENGKRKKEAKTEQVRDAVVCERNYP